VVSCKQRQGATTEAIPADTACLVLAYQGPLAGSSPGPDTYYMQVPVWL
jgi:hypothetical protein